MTSLRRRLTISYTMLVGAFIALIAVVFTGVAFDAVVRPMNDAIASAANEARALAGSQPALSAEAIANRVRTLVSRDDVAVFVMRRPGGSPGVGPPGFGGPPGEGRPGGGPFGPPADLAGRPGPSQLIASFAGVHGEFVRAAGGQVAIMPERTVLEARVQQFALALAVVVVFGVFAAWLIARWGAGAQVTAAFEERERSELRMRRFLADAGHELRTPLTIVTAYIDVLRKGVDDAELRAQAFQTLGVETKRMRRLVDRLAALARLEQPETTHPVVVDVGALAQDAVAAIDAARPGDVRCDVESGAFVLADPAELHEAIANIVENALKYGGGTPVRVAVEHERNAVVVRVSDRGPGIAPADREKIFERFYRAAGHADVEGSGLGLAIATRAAARAGGTLALERSDGGETVFGLRLPLHVATSV